MRTQVGLAVVLLLAAAAGSAATAQAQSQGQGQGQGGQGAAGTGTGIDDSGYLGPTVLTELYGHIYDLLENVPMNTHPMHAEAPDLARGYSEPTVAPTHGSQYNRIYWYNSMGPVSYNVSLQQPTVHPEQGLARDVMLDTGVDVMAFAYFSADNTEQRHAGFEGPVPVGAVPQFTVRAELRLGNDIRRDLDSGELIASGETTVDLVNLGSGEVTEIAINLGKPALEVIPRDQSFNLMLEWFQVENGDQQVLQPGWNIHTGAAHPNRLVLPVRNPVYLFFVEPQFLPDEKVVVNAAFNSPFGNYDIDPFNMHMTITGPGGFTPQTISQPVLIQQAYHHNDHHVAALNAWVWDYKTDKAPPGNYTVKVHGTNLAGTAGAEKSARFTIQDPNQGQRNVAEDSDGEQVITQTDVAEAQERAAANDRESPGPGALAGLAALGALALALRRRQGS